MKQIINNLKVNNSDVKNCNFNSKTNDIMSQTHNIQPETSYENDIFEENSHIEKTCKNDTFFKKFDNNSKTDKNKIDFNITKFFKIKQVKTAVIVLIFGLIALFILNSSLGENVIGSSAKSSDDGYMTSLEYCEKLETKLVEVLQNISGVGKVNVMVSVESAPEIKIATSTNEKTNTTSSGLNTTTNSSVVSDPIIVNGSGVTSPLVLTEFAPKVTGVVVVADGAKDVRVRLNLLEAIESLLNVSSENIQIFY